MTVADPSGPSGPSGTADQPDATDITDPATLATQARELIEALGQSVDPEAFQELLGVSAAVGVALGESARTLAEAQSWTQVATYAGTSKQAAWSRWRG